MKKPFSTENITTLISKATEITGDVHFSGVLEVEGKVRGNIYADDDSSAEVRVRESGLVQGEIKVPSVIINGLVEGDVHSTQHLELAAKARSCGKCLLPFNRNGNGFRSKWQLVPPRLCRPKAQAARCREV